MNSALTLAAHRPRTRRIYATKGLRTCAVATLMAVASGAAFAADIAVVRRPPPPAPVPTPIPYIYNWTGFYIGGNLGGAWESSTITDPFFGVSFSNSRSGFVGGGQVGYNWQLSPQWVIGIEGTFDGTDIRSEDASLALGLVATSKVDWIATVAGRLGWAANNWLFYAKGGGGWVHDTVTLTDVTGFSVSTSDSKGGWLVGAGIEYGITQNWTIKVEWDHIGLDSTTGPGFTPFDTVSVSRHFELVTAGLNYKF
jgi:outer membrane immunogenic protein